MAYTYVVLIVHGRRTLEQVPAKLGPAAVIAEAKKRIGTDVNGIILTHERPGKGAALEKNARPCARLGRCTDSSAGRKRD